MQSEPNVNPWLGLREHCSRPIPNQLVFPANLPETQAAIADYVRQQAAHGSHLVEAMRWGRVIVVRHQPSELLSNGYPLEDRARWEVT